MRIYLVTANAQDHNEYIEYRDQPYNPDSFTDTPMHMGETSYTAGFVSIMGVYTTREQAETRVNKLTREKFPVFVEFGRRVDGFGLQFEPAVTVVGEC